MDFLANLDNKEELNNFIADKILNGEMDWNEQYCVTCGRTGMRGNLGCDLDIITVMEFFNLEAADNRNRQHTVRMLSRNLDGLEEADNRLVYHVFHMLQQGLKSITIRTLDNDVIIVLKAFMNSFLSIV